MVSTSTQQTSRYARPSFHRLIRLSTRFYHLENQFTMAEEDGQELVTKPFKFVTGKSDNTAEKFIGQDPEANYVDSRYALPSRQNSIASSHSSQLCSIGFLNTNSRLFLGTDARFPNMNQTKHCWQNYVDYHKCITAKGEDFAPCRQVRNDENTNL